MLIRLEQHKKFIIVFFFIYILNNVNLIYAYKINLEYILNNLQIQKMSKLVENYLLQEPIGKGVYGKVYRAIHQKTKQQYAVKAIPKSVFQSNPKLQQLAINQIKILSSLKNNHVVKFIQTLKTPNNFYFVYQYCNGGALDGYLQKRKFLPEKQALSFFSQLLDAFKELNKNSVMHRDLKPDNIFLSDGRIKLGDFGFCKFLQVNMAQTMLGSPIYMAPQILKQQIYTSKADIWSLGVVLFEMLFGYCPFQSSSINDLINVLKESQLIIPQNINPISASTKELLQKILVKDQFKRIEWVDLFEYRLDQDGLMTCPVKKDYSAFQSLENYFLFNESQPTKGQSISYISSDKQIKFDSNGYSGKSNFTRTGKQYKAVVTGTTTNTTNVNANTNATTSISHFQAYSSSSPPPSFITQQVKSAQNLSVSNQGSRKFIPSRSPGQSPLQAPSPSNKIEVTSFSNFADQFTKKVTVNSQKNVKQYVPQSNSNTNPNKSIQESSSLMQSPNLSQKLQTEITISVPATNNYRLNQVKTNIQSDYNMFPTIKSKQAQNVIKYTQKLQNNLQNEKQKELPLTTPYLTHQRSQQMISTTGNDITTLKHTISESQKKNEYELYQGQGTNKVLSNNNKNKSTCFETTHEEWTKIFQIMQQIASNPNYQKEPTETIVYWLLISLNKKISSQSLNFPEWTDVIQQEKKVVCQALKEMNKMDQGRYKDYQAQLSEKEDGKNEIFKIWKRTGNKQFKENLFERAIRFMYSNEHNTKFTVQQVLLT